jgi:hypothetical protein
MADEDRVPSSGREAVVIPDVQAVVDTRTNPNPEPLPA